MSRGRVSKSVCQRKAEEMLIRKDFPSKMLFAFDMPMVVCVVAVLLLLVFVEKPCSKNVSEWPLCFLMNYLGSDRLFSVTQLLKNVPC